MYLLSCHLEWQDKARAECQALASTKQGAPLDYDDLASLSGLDRIFKESLRLYPVVPLMVRRTTREVELSGIKVPAHSLVCTVSSFNHYMEEYWTSPNTFDPDRLNDDRAEQKRHGFSFVPFGGGAHKCIGMHFAVMNVKLFMYEFLNRYKFELAADASHKMQAIPLPKPADGVKLKVTPL